MVEPIAPGPLQGLEKKGYKIREDSRGGNRIKMYLVGRGLFILFLFAAALLAGCSIPEIPAIQQAMPAIQQAIPEEPEFTYSISTSAPPIQISGGNLHWHRELPNDTYTLEDIAVEIHNFGSLDITVSQIELVIDRDSKLFNIDVMISKGTRRNVVVHPMTEGYDGGTHTIYLALLDNNGTLLCDTEQVVGPLHPVSGTGSWHPAQG